MTFFWSAVAVLTAVVVCALLLVLKRRPDDADARRLDYDVAIYKDQLAELEHDLARGTITETEAQAAREEIERRILTVAKTADEKAAGRADAASGSALIAAGLIIIFIPAVSFGLYAKLGAPDLPDIPYAERDIAAEQERQQRLAEAQEMAGLIQKLEERLEADPNNLRGWLLLGRTYLTMEREADAIAALRKAASIAPEDTAVAVELAEALVVTADNRIGDEARKIFQGVMSRDARNPRARYYLALGDAQAGKLKEALQGWVDLLAVSPPNAPWRDTVTQSIQRAAQDMKIDPAAIKPSQSAILLGPGKPPAPAPTAEAPGPTREQVEAAGQMSAEDRQQMIRGMVDRLAERLQENPDDREGWQRLARAYRVLGETAKAEAAEARAKALQ